MTEKFYNVLWWSNNACQYRFGSPRPLARPQVPTRHHHIATVTKDFAQYRVYHPFTSRTASTPVIIDFQSASKCFCDVVLALEAWLGGGGAELELARILTPPQHTVKFFCHLHRLYYYVLMLRYFFRILFCSLYCAVMASSLAFFMKYISIHSAFGLVIYHTLF